MVGPHTEDWYSAAARRSIEAYALYVRWRNGEADPERTMRLIDEAGRVARLPLEALGWISPVLSNAGSDAEVLASIRRHGVWDYSYVATATTPGHFVAPPPKAEEMYSPETFGRGAQDRVIVE